jgi:uncharacterized membrane protein YbhN (UPF0104 family)
LQFFNQLPEGLHSFFRALYTVAAIWAVGIVVVAALVARRWRLARDLLISGVLAWVVGRLIGVLIVQNRSIGKSIHLVTRFGQGSPNFPQVRVAVVVAILGAAVPYLTRPTRRIGQALTLLLVFGAAYLGTAGPNGLLAAVFLGWGLAAVVHLAFGSPGGRPTAAQVEAAVHELGVPATGVHLAPQQAVGSTLMLAEERSGPLRIKVMGRDEADSQLLAKLWRFILYKDSGPTFFLTRMQDLEHQAYISLLAERAGVRVPELVATGRAGPGAALLVSRAVSGPRLADLEPASVSDDQLVPVWKQVSRLRAAGIAHGRLNAGNVIMSDDGPILVEASNASSSASAEVQSRDVAELLASTAGIVGEDRAVAAAIAGTDKGAVAAALPFLQSAALSPESRSMHPMRRRQLTSRLNRLREVGAQATDTKEPQLEELHRVKASSILMAVGSLLAVAALLGQVGSPAQIWDTLKTAQWAWVVIAFALSMANTLPFAVAFMGTIAMRLPLWRTTELQSAVYFSNIAVPGVGGAVVQIRYLQKQGAGLAEAVAAGGLISTAAFTLVQICIFALALVLAPQAIHFGNINIHDLVVLVLIVVLAVVAFGGLAFGIPKIRRAVMPPVAQATSTLWGVIRSPRQLLLLLGGNAAATVVSGFAFLACLEAFGASVSLWTLLAIYVGIGTIASLVPIPGGSTAVGAVGMSGALIAAGLSKDVAVAAVLTQQLVTVFLPAVPGWVATRNLIDHDYL